MIKRHPAEVYSLARRTLEKVSNVYLRNPLRHLILLHSFQEKYEVESLNDLFKQATERVSDDYLAFGIRTEEYIQVIIMTNEFELEMSLIKNRNFWRHPYKDDTAQTQIEKDESRIIFKLTELISHSNMKTYLYVPSKLNGHTT